MIFISSLGSSREETTSDHKLEKPDRIITSSSIKICTVIITKNQRPFSFLSFFLFSYDFSMFVVCFA